MASPFNVLVAYAGRLGSTAEIATVLGEELSEGGAAVAVESVDQVADLSGFDAVVLGSAIRYDRWLPEATAFVEQYREALGGVPVACFFTCLVLAKSTPDTDQKAAIYAQQIARQVPGVQAADVGRFAGVLDLSAMSRPSRWLMRGVSLVSGVSEGDYRDWEAIRSWGHQGRQVLFQTNDHPVTLLDGSSDSRCLCQSVVGPDLDDLEIGFG